MSPRSVKLIRGLIVREEKKYACPFFLHLLTPLVPQSRFGEKPLKNLNGVNPQIDTAVFA